MDKVALQKEMNGMIDRLRDRSEDAIIEIGDENELTEIVIS